VVQTGEAPSLGRKADHYARDVGLTPEVIGFARLNRRLTGVVTASGPSLAAEIGKDSPLLVLECDLDYQDWVSVVNRIPGPFEMGQAFQPDMA
jgi:hypothetical protein